MNSKVIDSIIQGATTLLCLLLLAPQILASNHCDEPVSRVVSIEGKVKVKIEGQVSWQTVNLEMSFCAGDMLQTGPDSRAAVVLANEAILRIDQRSTVLFGEKKENSSLLEILKGALHIFSTRPRSLKVVTPYVNGVIEGTEFFVRVDKDSSFITVFEGHVMAVNDLGSLELSGGQSAVVKKDELPVYKQVVRPRDAVEWTLYYPAIVASSEITPENEISRRIGRASSALTVGRVDAAREDLDAILENEPGNSDALALLSIVETVQNNREKALKLAQFSVRGAPGSATGNLALSYAYQALFDIDAALETLKKADSANPGNGLVVARLAELLLSVGDLDGAATTATEAVALAPGSGLSHTILGFVFLSRTEIVKAREAFYEAIARDSSLPLARLGLGLSLIRQGKLAKGRAEIEIAAALDPAKGLIRSYLGKAYFAEKRDTLSRRQYEIAKQLDPSDPTPWFYDAIRKQTENRPVQALQDIQASIAKNDNRAVYRSRLLLDDDLASRSASLGRIYTDLGFEQLASAEGWKSLQYDPTNYSAHRFVADTYVSQPYHETSRLSELLQSQLLQPINITPVQPQLAEKNLPLIEGAGSGSATFNEFNSLFLKNDVHLLASGSVGSNDILGDELALSGVWGKMSYSLGQLHYETEGIRLNNDQDEDIYNVFLQSMISPKTSFLAEYRYREKEYGDLQVEFDPEEFSSSQRQTDQNKSLRIGFRHDFKPNSTVIGTGLIGNDYGRARSGGDGYAYTFDIKNEVDNRLVELQHLYRGEWFNIRSGFGLLDADEEENQHLSSFVFDMSTHTSGTTEHANIYSYGQLELLQDLVVTLGLSGDELDSPRKDRSEINPKLGVTWQPVKTTLMRVAAFKTVMRRLIHSQTIEPTIIAGFNQYFDDKEATDYWVYGVGVDQTITPTIFAGLEYYHRDLDVPYESFRGPQTTLEDDWQEDIGSAYVYWAAADRISLGLEYFYEDVEHDVFSGLREIQQLTTHRVTPKIRYFHPCGLSAMLQASYVDQEGVFFRNLDQPYEGHDSFWLVDAALGYRLPRRYGFLKLEVKNLFDKQFRYTDTDPTNPRFLPELQLIGSLTVTF